MLFGICPHASHGSKFWHMYVITYSNFMAIVEPCHEHDSYTNHRNTLFFIETKIKKKLWSLFMDGVQQATELLWGDSLLFTINSPGGPGTHKLLGHLPWPNFWVMATGDQWVMESVRATKGFSLINAKSQQRDTAGTRVLIKKYQEQILPNNGKMSSYHESNKSI